MTTARMLLVVALGLVWAACKGSPTAPAPIAPKTPAGTTTTTNTGQLTERVESENFVFHFAPGDRVQIVESEAYHRWAVAYLDVTPPKKIDFYKYPTSEALARAVGVAVGGRALATEFSVATFYPWHNHECFHLYTWLLGLPTMLFSEGMAVAHEFDPSNNDWVAHQIRGGESEPYIDMVLGWRARGQLYLMEPLLESETFAKVSQGDTGKQAYRQSGMFVWYLIERFGLERMKDVFRQVQWSDSIATVKAKFRSIYGISFQQAEADWLAYLDARLAGSASMRGRR